MSLCVCVMCELSVLFNGVCFCRSGTDEEYKEKKKLLQDITDLKRDGDEHRRVLALAKKAESDAKKRSADLRLVAMRASKAGDFCAHKLTHIVPCLSHKGWGGEGC